MLCWPTSRAWRLLHSKGVAKRIQKGQGNDEYSDGGKTLEKFLSSLEPELAEHYRIERWQSGTTGKGHNCPHPISVVALAGCCYQPTAELVASEVTSA